ncbi:hypothetical protein BGX26_008043, partial [Mortierella sp. AD094]
TTYDLGLCGTADSILDLGALGQVEVKGIKLDVKTSLKGLQGLKNADFITLLAMTYNVDFIVSCLVNIHNPSDLTLRLGDLNLNMGTDETPAGFAGVASMVDMVLVPGDNQITSYATLPPSNPGAVPLIIGPNTAPEPVVMYAFSGSSNNTALNAGLTGLETHMVLPLGMVPTFSGPAYQPDWTVKFLPTTVQDGLVEMTATFNNPFYGSVLHFVNAQPTDNPLGSMLNTFGIAPPGTNVPLSIFNFLDNLHFDLQPNASKTITFQMQIVAANIGPNNRDIITSWVQGAAATGVLKDTNIAPFQPSARIGNDPHELFPDYSSP